MKSPLGSLLGLRNQARTPPIPMGSASAGHARGLSFNLGAGRGNRETYLRQYGASGTIYGIISLLAEAAATPTWHLYQKPSVDGRRRYSTGDQGSDQRVEVIQHAAIKLWNSPNDWHSGFEFREGCQQHEELTGETFWVLDTEAGFPTGMWYVRPDRMEPVPDPDQFLVGWIYTGPNGQSVPLKASEVIVEKRPDPLDPYRGAGPVASILPNIQQQKYATEYQRNLFLNGADPGGVITVPTNLSDAQFDQLIDRWRESHRGVARAGAVGVLEAGAEWSPNAHTNKDMEYGQLRLANRDELREAWRIHKTMMGTSDDVNRANAQTAQEVFVGWQVLPRLNRRRDTLNSKLLPLFGTTGTGVEFDYDDPSPQNAEAAANEMSLKATAAQTLVNAGYDPSDVLEVVGLPDMRVVEKATQAPALPPAWVPQQPAGAGAPGAPAAYAREVINAVTPPQTQAPAQGQQPPALLQAVDTQWKAAVAMLTAAWLATVTPRWISSLTSQVREQVGKGNLIGLAALTLDTTAATGVIYEHADAYAQAAANQAAAEAHAAGAPGASPVTPPSADLKAAAAAAAALAAQQLALTAGREATRLAAGPDPDPDQVADQTRTFLQGLSDAAVTGMAAGVMSMAQNTARLATIAAGPRAELVATEMHDHNSCSPCDEINGTSFGYSDDPDAIDRARAAYPAGGYIACEGGTRCRGTVYGNYGAPVGNRAAPGIQAKDAAAKVFEQTAQDYPPAATAWMHHATWSGPVAVPIDHIQPQIKWMDGADPQHVADFVKKRQQGKKLKPVILVKTPGNPRLLLVDGHHRYLAEAELDEPVRAFIGTVAADHGPWESMHDQQRGNAARNTAAARAAPGSGDPQHMADLVRRIQTDGYVPVEVSAGRY